MQTRLADLFMTYVLQPLLDPPSYSGEYLGFRLGVHDSESHSFQREGSLLVGLVDVALPASDRLVVVIDGGWCLDRFSLFGFSHLGLLLLFVLLLLFGRLLGCFSRPVVRRVRPVFRTVAPYLIALAVVSKASLLQASCLAMDRPESFQVSELHPSCFLPFSASCALQDSRRIRGSAFSFGFSPLHVWVMRFSLL